MRVIYAAIVIALCGCTTVETTARPESYYTRTAQADSAAALFKSEPGRLSDEEIERIINHRLALPKQNRVAILALSGANLWRFYSDDFVQLSDAVERDFVGTLKSSGRVYDASFLPALLVPENRTVGHLREAAARYQADLLLAYRTRCASFENFRLLAPDETRAYCSVESVLIDVRTGIVPFTSVSVNNVEATKRADDRNMAETIKKNELSAIGKSLGEVAEGLVRFLDQVPVRR
jgi:hypothetical protein